MIVLTRRTANGGRWGDAFQIVPDGRGVIYDTLFRGESVWVDLVPVVVESEADEHRRVEHGRGSMTMTRRSALQAIGGGIAAALWGPIVVLRPEVDREAILATFCDDAMMRYDIDRPFAIGPYTYATDARHAVRTELVSRVESEPRRIPDMDAVWQEFWHPAESFRPLELPKIEDLTLLCKPQSLTICPACGNRRVSCGREYPDQDRMEWLSRHFDYDVDDNSQRDPTCELCHGREYSGPSEVMLCGERMTYWRAQMLTLIPGVEVAASHSGPVLFRGGGFEGMSMGLLK